MLWKVNVAYFWVAFWLGIDILHGGFLTWSSELYIPSKYSKHWPYPLASTINCDCSKILNHVLSHGLFLSRFGRKYVLNWIENSGLKYKLLHSLRFEILLDSDANLPKTNPFSMGPNGQMFIVLGMYNFADHQNLPPFIFKGKIIQGSIRKDVDILLVKGPIVYCSSSFLISAREGYLDHNICLFNVKSISKDMKKRGKGN